LKKVGVWRAAAGESNRESWDFGRFVNTLLFFNGPPSLQKFVASVVQAMTGKTEQADVEQANRKKKQEEEEVVLVVGATGGVGKRVVDELRKRGYRTRALVRNLEKAKQLLSSEVEIVMADIMQAATLLPEYFAGVKKVVHTASVTVGPKEGDTADR
jgi:NADP-dependent 3-hydroxy acid dehydrogenase YdfG